MFSSSCDECKPGGHGLPDPSTLLFSSLPFLATFAIIFVGSRERPTTRQLLNAQDADFAIVHRLLPLEGSFPSYRARAL